MKSVFLLLLSLSFPLAGRCESGHHDAHAEPKHDNHGTAEAKEEKAEAKAPAAHSGPHWSYAGDTSPERWGDLAPEFAACREGHQQSPVDLKWQKQKGNRKIDFYYQKGELAVIDNGHTIQVNVPPGSFVEIGGHRYDLVQFHFHAESEHSFNGRHFPLEAHFVHKDSQGKLAVIGVMFDSGARNESLGAIFSNLPNYTGKELRTGVTFDPYALIPKKRTHYQYSGSLTTPPCSEGVNWTVMNTPLELADDQLEVFHRLYVKNNRPIQPLMDRRPASFQ